MTYRLLRFLCWDPGSNRRLKQPCRGLLCDHIDVFELPDDHPEETHICPVCGKEYSQADLEVDGFLLEISMKALPETKSVTIYSDGAWEEEAETDRKEFKRKRKELGYLLQEMLAKKLKEPVVVDLCDD